MHKRIYQIIAVLVITSSCTNSKEETAVSDSLQQVKQIIAEDSLLIFDNTAGPIGPNAISGLPATGKLLLKDYWIADSLPFKAFKPGKKFYADYSSVLKWSADSNYVIDGGSYGGVVITGADGKKRVEAGEADTEIALILPKQQQRTRLIFAGPGTELIQFGWADSTTAALWMAFDEKGNGNIDTTLWLIDVNDRYFRKYKLQ